MDIDSIKDKLSNLVKYNLFQSTFLTEEKIKDVREIEHFLKSSDDIVADIKSLYNSGKKEYLYSYSYNIKYILRGIELSYIDEVNILNSDIDYNISIIAWNKLVNKEKISYLSGINTVNKKIISLVNFTLGNSKNKSVFNLLINNKRIFDKFPDNSLTISSNYLDGNNILNFDNYKKIKYIIVDYTVDNFNIINKQPWILGKLRKKDVEKLNLDNCINNIKTNNIDDYTNKLIKEFKGEIKFNEDFIKNSKINSIIIFPFDNIEKDLLNTVIYNYDYLIKFKMDIMVMIINTFLNEEEKVDLLRKEEFINYLDSESLEDLLNNLEFKSVFNMLQNINILEKVRDLNIIIKEEDSIFITGYLDSPALVNKTNKAMLRDMLDIIKDKAISYIKLPYISSLLNIKIILDIALRNNIDLIDLYENEELKYRIKRNDLIYYIDNYWSVKGIDYDLIFNKHNYNLLFNIEMLSNERINEVRYLYDSIYIKGVKRIKSKIANFETFKAVFSSYLLFGLKCTQNIAFVGNKDVKLNIVKRFKSRIVNDVKNYILIDKDKTNKFISHLNDCEYLINDNIDDICETDSFIKEIVDTIINTGCVTINDLNNIINDYISSLEYNFDNSDKEIKQFIESVNKFVIAKREKIFNNNYDMIIKRHFLVKEDIKFKKQQSLGKKYIEEKQISFLIRALIDSNNYYGDYFINEETYNSFKTIVTNYLGKEDENLQSIVYKIFNLYDRNNNDIYSCLDTLGIKMPEYYPKFMQIKEEEELVKSINKKLKKLFKDMHITRINALLKNICYETEFNFQISDDISEDIEKYGKLLINLNGKVDVSMDDSTIIYTSPIVFPNLEELNDYNLLISKIKTILSSLKNFAIKWISEDKVKEMYRKEYTEVINSDDFNYRLNKNNYKLDIREFYIDDFAYIFNNIPVDLNIKNISSLKKLLIDMNLVEYVGDGYLFSDYPLAFIINNWDSVYDKIDFSENIVNIYFEIKKLDPLSGSN